MFGFDGTATKWGLGMLNMWLYNKLLKKEW
jgi:hypothetical protein